MATIGPEHSFKDLIKRFDPVIQTWIESLNLPVDEAYSIGIDQPAERDYLKEALHPDGFKRYRPGRLLTITVHQVAWENGKEKQIASWAQSFQYADKWEIAEPDYEQQERDYAEYIQTVARLNKVLQQPPVIIPDKELENK